jgi:peptidylprolyl isomerase
VTKPVKDRSGLGLPPKAERRAAGKIARQRRRRAEQWRKVIRMVGTALAVVVVVGGIAVACGAFRDDTTTNPAASPTAPALDPALSTKPVVSAGTGDLTALNVEKLVTGTGPEVKSGQTISVNYVGVSYTSGEEFDSSWKTGQPLSTPIGVGKVIPGWDQGLVGVPVGSRVQLDIPAELAYGTDGANGPPGPLRFVVDILSAK